MTILFCLLVTTGFLFAVLPNEMGRKVKDSEAKKQGYYVLVALFFASFWMLMRVTFLVEEKSLYENPLLEVHVAFLFLFVGLFVLVSLLSYYQRHHEEDSDKKGGPDQKAFEVIFITIGLMEGIVAGLEFGGVAPQIGNVLVFVFGTKSSILSYLSVFTVIFAFSLPFILQRLGKNKTGDAGDQEDEDNDEGNDLVGDSPFLRIIG